MSEGISAGAESGSQGTETGTSEQTQADPKGQTEGTGKKETVAQKEKRILEAKVNGKTIKVSEDDLLRDFSKYSSADEKFREAAEGRKHVEAFKKQFRDDPEAAMDNPDIPEDVKYRLAEKWLVAKFEKEMAPAKSPEQLELEELRKEREERQKKETEDMSNKEKEEFSKIVNSRREAIAKTFQDAIALSPLAKDEGTSAEVVREMAIYMRLCKEAGHDATPQEIADHVQKRFMSSYQNLTENMSGQDLVDFLGAGIIKKLREYDLGQLESRRNRREPDQATDWQPKERKNRSFTNPRDLIRAK